MGHNGRQHPPRPRIEVAQATATPEEAAAIAAAIEQFLHDTSPPPDPGVSHTNPWLRAGLLENAGLAAGGSGGWGDAEPWGAR